MKKIIYTLAIVSAVLSSCLKDKPNVDFSNLGTVVELVESGKAYFAQDAITSTADTISGTFQLNIASPNVPTSDITVTIGVDTTQTAKYNAYSSTVTYVTMPSSAYVFPTQTVTVKAGTRLATLKYVVYKNKLDPSLSYMLPISILSASQGTISGNFGIHYYHIIGNDFAGTYTRLYTRYNAGDSTSTTPTSNKVASTVTLSPVSAVQFEMPSGYYYNARYEVTFTKSGNGASATYSNFAVTLNADDVAYALSVGPVTLKAPSFASLSAASSYTKAQVLARLSFFYAVSTSTASRFIIDQYKK